MRLEVLAAGLFTTVQDLGRPGFQREGVPVGGAMDEVALRVANLLVGNLQGAAALEVTLRGPTLLFHGEALVAVGGGELGASVGGADLPPWRPARLPAGSTLSFRGARRGARAYLAVAGGIDVPPVLGSRSTLLRAGMGGLEGRALRRGDVLATGAPSDQARRILRSLPGDAGGPGVARWGAGPSLLPWYSDNARIRLLPGTHQQSLAAESLRDLHEAEFRVSARSDRSGYRLEGPALALHSPMELLSEAVAFGTLQLPPDGSPIVLMADRQTTGGYPRIGEVASVDLPLLAQLRPGDRLRFEPCPLAEAQRLRRGREAEIARLAEAISLRVR